MRRTLLVLLVTVTASSAGAVELEEGDWIVADPDANAVYRVDPGTGDAMPISQDGMFRYPSGVALDAQRRLLVADPDANAVFRVDPATGAQEIVSSGSSFRYPTGVATDATGDILVADPDAAAVFRVHPVTGDQTLDTAADDAGLVFATGVAVEASGDYVLADPDAQALTRWNPDLASGATVSSEGLFDLPSDATVDDTGDLLVADPDANGFLRVEPIAGTQVPAGPDDAFLYPAGIAYVPEPGSAWQLAVGLAAAVALARSPRAARRRRV